MQLFRNVTGAIYRAIWIALQPKTTPYGNPSAAGFSIGAYPWADGTSYGTVEPKNSTSATAVAIIKNSNTAGIWAAVTTTVSGGYICEINSASYRKRFKTLQN